MRVKTRLLGLLVAALSTCEACLLGPLVAVTEHGVACLLSPLVARVWRVSCARRWSRMRMCAARWFGPLGAAIVCV